MSAGSDDCYFDEVDNLEHELEHHGSIHVAAGGSNEIAGGGLEQPGK